jgi:hypothetical protein
MTQQDHEKVAEHAMSWIWGVMTSLSAEECVAAREELIAAELLKTDGRGAWQ